MARVHRVVAFGAFATILYLLAFFQFISVPLLDSKVADAIIPVVRLLLAPPKRILTGILASNVLHGNLTHTSSILSNPIQTLRSTHLNPRATNF